MNIPPPLSSAVKFPQTFPLPIGTEFFTVGACSRCSAPWESDAITGVCGEVLSFPGAVLEKGAAHFFLRSESGNKRLANLPPLSYNWDCEIIHGQITRAIGRIHRSGIARTSCIEI